MLKFKELGDKKKRLIIIVSALVVFIGITLAYVVGQISDGSMGKANITADTTDNLQFNVDKDINLNPTQFNVPEGGGGLSDTAIGTATLLANSTNKTATYDYYVYFNIKSNNYTYTTEEQKPEIVLTITDPTGEVVTSIEGLTYVTAQNADGSEVNGFDITTKSGLFNVASLYEITSNSSTDVTVQDWKFTVTFINLTTNQAANGGSTLDAEIILSKNERYTLANYIINKVYVEDGVNGLYYHDGQGTYTNAELEAGDNSYRYTGGDYLLTEKAISNGYTDLVVDSIEKTGSLVNFYCDGVKEDFDQRDYCRTNPYYTTAYDETNHYIIMGEAFKQAIIDGYLTDDNIKNYVCFGSNEVECPYDNLYRIIGIFDENSDGKYQIKLIKADYISSDMLGTDSDDFYGKYYGSNDFHYRGNLSFDDIAIYKWNGKSDVSEYGSNNWETSDLNNIHLNKNYINYLGSKWNDYITDSTWYLGGMGGPSGGISVVDVKQFYIGERNNISELGYPFTVLRKIGLMNVSDYLYAILPENWSSYFLWNDDTINITDNWLNLGLSEWTMMPSKSSGSYHFYVSESISTNHTSTTLAIRPVFYLKDNVMLGVGTGTASDPYRIA